MAKTQKEVVAFANSAAEYARCLEGELSQKSIGKSDAEKTELGKSYVASYQPVAQEATGLAMCFNEQLETFKKSGGGTSMRPADCASHIAAAANRTAAAPSADELVIEASGHTFELPSGQWRFLLARDAAPRACDAGTTNQCLYRPVIVLNESNETLECTGEIAYDGTDIAGNARTEAKALVLERSTRIVAASLAKDNVSASVFDARCTARPKLPALTTASTCKYEVVKPVAIADYYPPDAREAGEEGPVTVEFTVAGKAGNPKDVRAVASSLYPKLDEAAVRAVSDMVMSSNCRDARYRLRVSFKLEG
jgi:TonB family protein